MVLLVTSCNKDDDQVPQLPPVESFQMDFSDFTTFPDTTDSKKSVSAHRNFAHSFGTVDGIGYRLFIESVKRKGSRRYCEERQIIKTRVRGVKGEGI